METYHGNTINYWKENAEKDYYKTPISVLKYIAVLEEQAQQLNTHVMSSCGHSTYTSGCDECRQLFENLGY